MSLFKKLAKNNIGLSLVELIITIALMSIVSVAIGSAIVSATTNYRRNSEEVAIQQDVQNITNIIANMIFDSVEANNTGNEGGENLSNLFILSSTGVYYSISCSGGKLFYGESTTGYPAVSSLTKVLAENVSAFSANTSTYSHDYIVKISLAVNSQTTDKTMMTSFAVTSRNAEGGNNLTITDINGAVIAIDTMAVIEPNQVIDIPYEVLTSGNVDDTSIKLIDVTTVYGKPIVMTAALATNAEGKSVVRITANDEKNDIVRIKVRTNAKYTDDEGNEHPFDEKVIKVYVRRVTKIDAGGAQTNQADYANCKAGSKYEVSAAITAINGDRFYTFKTDNDYVNTYKLVWTVTGNTEKMTGVTNPAGGSNVSGNIVCDDATKKWKFTINSDFAPGEYITFTCRALHSDGTFETLTTNKTGLPYGEFEDSWTLTTGFFDNINDKDFKRANDDTNWVTPAGFDNMDNLILKYYVRNTPEYLAKVAQLEAADAVGYDIENKLLQYKKDNGLETGISGIESAMLTAAKAKYDFNFCVFGSVGTPNVDTGVCSWSRYITLQPKGGTNYRIDKALSYMMDSDKEYQFEFLACLTYVEKANTSNKYVLWPNYNKVLETNMGFKEAGYQASPLWGPQEGSAATLSFSGNNLVVSSSNFITKTSEGISAGEPYASYARTMGIGKGDFYFKEDSALGIVEEAPTAGSVYDPIILMLGMGAGYTINIDKAHMTGLGSNEFMHVDGILQYQRSDGTWVTLDDSVKSGTPNYKARTGNYINMGDGWIAVYCSEAKYEDVLFRVLFTESNRPKAYVKTAEGAFSTNLYMTTDSRGNLSANYTVIYDNPKVGYTYPLYDLSQDKGILYFKVADTNGTFGNGAGSLYPITLDPNGGTVSKTKITIYTGQKVENLVDPVREHYNFAGWFTAKDGGTEISNGSSFDSLGGAKTLYAHWTEKDKVTVTLDANGGKNPTPSTFTVYVGETLTGLKDATHSDNTKKFIGWFTAADGGEMVINGASYDVVKDTPTLYAHYRDKQSITINLNTCNKGSVAGGVTTITVIEDGKVPTLPNVTPYSQTSLFTGWATAENGGSGFATGMDYADVVGITTIYAQYNDNPDVIVLDYNDGTGKTGTALYTENGTKIGQLPTASRNGYDFIGWFDSPTDGKKYNSYDWTGSRTVSKLYAVYYPKTLLLNANGGSVSPSQASINNGQIQNLPTPNRNGYVFIGWNTSADGSGVNVNSYSSYSNIIGVTTLYALWTEPQYSVSVKYNGVVPRWGSNKKEYEITIQNTGTVNVSSFNINVGSGAVFHSADNVNSPTANGSVWTFTPYNAITPGNSILIRVYINEGTGTIDGKG